MLSTYDLEGPSMNDNERCVDLVKEDTTLPLQLNERVLEWFNRSVGEPTLLQSKAWSSILEGRNTLIISPTGSGKTLAAVLPAISNLVSGRWGRRSISVVYISPMRALGADLVRNIGDISKGIGPFPGRSIRKRHSSKRADGPEEAPLDIGIRTGDVPQSERRRLLTHPPDILVITPENLLLMLCSGARETLMDVSCVVLDELHDLAASKRGALLSLSLELLNDQLHVRGRPEPVRIGLSATVRPERTAAAFLGGFDRNGRPRPVNVVKEPQRKEMEIEVRTISMDDRTEDAVKEAVIGEVSRYIKGEAGPVVVFQNTRKGAEEMSFSLTQRGLEGITAHHGSLGPDVRRGAEEGLKTGKLKAIISSTSLELGVDIGSVGLVVQVASPRSPTKLIQRFGRSGHGLNRTSRGAILTSSRVDLIESMAVLRAASGGDIERLTPPMGPPDVLAQFIVGAAIGDDGLDPKRIMNLARRTFQFRGLKGASLKAVISLLTERLPGPKQPSPRLRIDGTTGLLRPNKDTKQAFYLNCGTIPRETNYKVMDVPKGHVVGELSRDFAESLFERDVIMLASKSFRVTGFSGSRVLVREDPGSLPTTPIWTGEAPARPVVVTREIYAMHARPPQRPSGSSGPFSWSMDGPTIDLLKDSFQALSASGIRPSEHNIPVERVPLPGGRTAHVVHLPLGKRSTDLLGRVISYGLRRRFGAAMDHIASDDGLAISSPLVLEEEDLVLSMPEGRFKDLAGELVLSSSMFRSRFASCAGRSLLVLSRFRGRDTGVMYRRSTMDRLLSTVRSEKRGGKGVLKATGPVHGLKLIAEEALKESMSEGTDLQRLEGIRSGVVDGRIRFEMLPPSSTLSFLGASIMRNWKVRAFEGEQGALLVDGPAGEHRSDHGNAPGTAVAMIGGELSSSAGPIYLQSAQTSIERRSRLEVHGGLERVLRGVPFFTHPLDIIRRARGSDLNQLRSAMKGGRLVPVRTCGKDRMAHPEWAWAFQVLSPQPPEVPKALTLLLLEGRPLSRAEVGAAAMVKGPELARLLEVLALSNSLVRFPAEARYHLGAPDGLVPGLPIKRSDDRFEAEQLKAILKVLSCLGPMTMTELAHMFNWGEGQTPKGISRGLEDGTIQALQGPPGPMDLSIEGRTGDIHIRSWLAPIDKGPKTWKGTDGEPTVMTSKDPSLVITGNAMEELEREHVRDTLPALLEGILPEGASPIQARVSERRDLVLFRELSIRDYSLVGSAGKLIMDAVRLYENLSYEVFCIDGLMGVPAGDTTPRLLTPLMEGGFSPVQTEKGPVLILGCEEGRGLDRERVLWEMLSRQGLLPEKRKRHPVEVLELLGGISDRWELLSRLGTSRYPRGRGLNRDAFSSRQKALWDGLGRILKGEPLWSDIPAPVELSEQMESLPEIRDLARGLGLFKVLLDQPNPVWAFEEEAIRAPPPSPGTLASLDKASRKLVERLLAVSRKASSDILKASDVGDEVTELVKSGLAVQDAWGGHQFPFDDSRFGRAHRRRDPNEPKGLRQRKWLIRCAVALGLFTMGDLLEYSPSLDDPCKVRTMLNELSRGPLTRKLYYDSGPVLVHGVPEAFEAPPGPPTSGQLEGTELTLISPRDRMARVLAGDVRALLSRRQGFLVMKGTRCLSTVNIVRSTYGRRKDGNVGVGPSYGGATLMIKKVWMDLRLKRPVLLRDIKRAFFEHGSKVLTIEEGPGLEELYRDINPYEDVPVLYRKRD